MTIQLRLGGPRGARNEFETLRGGDVSVESPRGVALPAELLIEALPKRPAAGKAAGKSGETGAERPVRALFGMDTEGAPAMVAAGMWPGAEIRWFHFDEYVAAKVRDVFADNARGGAAVPASAEALADLPPGPFDVVALPFPKMSESLLMTDLLEASHDALRVGGKLVAATDGNGAALGRAIENVFGKVTSGPVSRRGKTFFAERKRAKPALKDRAHVLSPEIRPAGGGDPIRMQIETRPGTFTHGSLDRGTRALLEWYVPGEDRNVLDLGAGCGAIGIYAALRIPEGRVTLVETNVRAAECARRNAERNGVADRVTFRTEAGQFVAPRRSLTGTAPETAAGTAPARSPRRAPGEWDCVLANPPYFSEMRIAREFCSTAHDALRAGGHVALVVRRGPAADLHSEVLIDVFKRVTTFDAGDYSILTAKR